MPLRLGRRRERSPRTEPGWGGPLSPVPGGGRGPPGRSSVGGPPSPVPGGEAPPGQSPVGGPPPPVRAAVRGPVVSSPRFTAGLAAALTLFLAVVAAAAGCFFCTCRYLARRRQRLQSPFAGQEIPMTGALVQPVYPYPPDPKAGPAPPPPGFLCSPSAPPQPPLYPAGPPVYSPAAPPPYLPPQPAYPGA